MTVVLKLTGFPFQTTSKEIITFLKKANLKYFEMFMSLEKSGKRKNMFDGTSYVIVKSEFDASCIMRLRENRVGPNFIGIYRCSGLELRDKNLFPIPSEKLFQLTDNYEQEGHQQPSIRTEGIQRKNTTTHEEPTKLHKPNVTLTDDFVGPDLHFSIRQNNFEKNINLSSNKYQNESYSPSTEIENFNNTETDVHYDCYVKIFYISDNITRQDVFSFVKSYSFPIDILFSKFDEGPHAGKNRGEVFVLLSSIREALKCIKLNSKKLENVRVSVVFPSNEEIDTVIFQNSKRVIQQPKQTPQAVSPSASKTDQGNLAYSLLEAVTHIINQNGSKQKNEPTMVDNLENIVNASIFDGIDNKSANPTSRFTLVKIMNVPSNVSSSDLIQFFTGFHFIPSSLKKISTIKNSCYWEIHFITDEEANKAIRKLNYQLLKYQPIELKIVY